LFLSSRAHVVAVPEGGVEKGQELEVPYPSDTTPEQTMSMSTPTPAATVKVTAPSTLEAGFTFEAVADDGKAFIGELIGHLQYVRCTVDELRWADG
jgi:hypothetical protein